MGAAGKGGNAGGGTPGVAGATSGGAGGKGGGGGTTALGGTPGTGGLGGAAGGGGQPATGGMPGTGGLQPTGGTMGTGGSTGGGGQPGTGGATGGGGSSGGGGKGGAGATGGGGGGGTAPVVFNCAASTTPAGGLIADFTSWDATTMRWTASTGAFGTVFAYHDANSTSTAAVGNMMNLHFTGTLAGYAGIGIVFDRCEAVGAGNTAIQFTVSGTAPNCALELQLQPYSLRPTTEVPAGGCTMTPTSNCYNMFPKQSNVATSGTVKVTLANMSMWTAARASEIVAVQFQLTGNCTADLRFDDIKFVP